MERRLEAVKLTMLKQEEIFKQQVRELHRVYSVQRMLMEEMRRRQIYRDSKTVMNSSINGWERSGSCSGGDSESRINAKRSFGFDLDVVRVGGSSCNTIMPSSSRTSGPGLEEELCGLDLTLSIGGGDKKRLKELQDNECSDSRELDQKRVDQGEKNT